MEPIDIDESPKGVPEDIWESHPPGSRIRLLRNHQYELDLTTSQYRALYRLPYWMLYGPEHGAPWSWFNRDGYLLPKYRPGGGRFPEFLSWRRTYRRRRWLHHKIRERFRLLRERHKTLYAAGALLRVLFYYAVLCSFMSWDFARARLDPGVHFLAMMAVMGLLFLGGDVLAARVQDAIVNWIAESRLSRESS